MIILDSHMTGHHARPTPSDHLSSAQGLDLDFGRPRARRRIHRGMHALATQLGNNVRFALNQLPALGSSDEDGYDTNLKSMFQFDTNGAEVSMALAVSAPQRSPNSGGSLQRYGH